MKIYTYYENIGFNKQNELIDLWKKSWKLNGFDPVILSREDAMKSDVYTEYYDFVQRVHVKAVGKELNDTTYCLAAQLEIAAFTTIEEPGFISDYDIINYKFKPYTPKERVHWLNDRCSCFASGGGGSWYDYINYLFSKEDQIVEFVGKISKETKRWRFHDQDFLEAVAPWGASRDFLKYFDISADKTIAGMYFPDNNIEDIDCYHISHNNINKIKLKEYSEYLNLTTDGIRIACAEEIIRNIGKC